MNFSRINTCRLCGNTEVMTTRLIKYAVRHYVHPKCGLKKWGAGLFARLTLRQLELFPALTAREAGLESELRLAIQFQKRVAQ